MTFAPNVLRETKGIGGSGAQRLGRAERRRGPSPEEAGVKTLRRNWILPPHKPLSGRGPRGSDSGGGVGGPVEGARGTPGL